MKRHPRAGAWRGGVGVLLLASLHGGCGRASVTGIPFNRVDLRDDEPLTWALPEAGRCAWYVDEAGHITIAMRYANVPLFGELSKVEWSMRFALDDPPAGSVLLYRVARDQLRGVYSGGLDHRRFQSRWGVLVLSRVGKDRFRGRFQIAVAHQQFSILGGWMPQGFAGTFIFWGEFEAVHDEEWAKATAAAIDAQDWSGLGPTATQRLAPLRGMPTTRRSTTRPAEPATRAVR